MNATRLVLMACLFLCFERAFAQSAEKETAVIEVGAAASQILKADGSSFGASVAVEVTPIENWLELEGGVTALVGRHSTEWDADLLFKKPWTLSKKAEFMFGAGPNGFRQVHQRSRQTQWAAKPCWILCFGPPRDIGSAGMLNPVTTITLGEDMTNRLV